MIDRKSLLVISGSMGNVIQSNLTKPFISHICSLMNWGLLASHLRNSREPVSCGIFHRAISRTWQIKFPGLFVLCPLKDTPPRAACPTLFRYYLEQKSKGLIFCFSFLCFLYPPPPLSSTTWNPGFLKRSKQFSEVPKFSLSHTYRALCLGWQT